MEAGRKIQRRKHGAFGLADYVDAVVDGFRT